MTLHYAECEPRIKPIFFIATVMHLEVALDGVLILEKVLDTSWENGVRSFKKQLPTTES
jgi:hypothetical protein